MNQTQTQPQTETRRHSAAVPGHPASELFAHVLNLPLPAARGPIRHAGRKVWAAQVRRLFRDLQIKGVSVTAPNYSMAHSIDVRLPLAPQHADGEAGQGGGYTRSACPICSERWAAQQRIEAIILAAFPDLDDRSDTRTDYFDFCLNVN